MRHQKMASTTWMQYVVLIDNPILLYQAQRCSELSVMGEGAKYGKL